MFHFPTFPPHALCVQAWVTGHDSCRVSPFGNPRINARLAAPRGLSQPPTSFIGSWCQGIHRAPLLAWPQRCSRPLCSSQGAGGPDRVLPPPAARDERGTTSDRSCPQQSAEPVETGRRFPGLSKRLARSLRTQQRARLAPAPTTSFRPEGRTEPPLPPQQTNSQCSTHELDERHSLSPMLLRKEVIQPHLPVRLPCYDFVPIADPTFDSSLPCGLGHWLRVLPTFVT